MAADPAKRAVDFMLLASPTALPDPILARRALLLTAVYRLHCSGRHGPPTSDPDILKRAFNQTLREAARGHTKAMRLLDSAWVVS